MANLYALHDTQVLAAELENVYLVPLEVVGAGVRHCSATDLSDGAGGGPWRLDAAHVLAEVAGGPPCGAGARLIDREAADVDVSGGVGDPVFIDDLTAGLQHVGGEGHLGLELLGQLVDDGEPQLSGGRLQGLKNSRLHRPPGLLPHDITNRWQRLEQAGHPLKGSDQSWIGGRQGPIASSE